MLQAILLRATSNVRFRVENDWWFEICDSVIVIVIYIMSRWGYWPTKSNPQNCASSAAAFSKKAAWRASQWRQSPTTVEMETAAVAKG
jgi:hypothetical protein